MTSEDYAKMLHEKLQRRTKTTNKKEVTPEMERQKPKRKEIVYEQKDFTEPHILDSQVAELVRQKTLYMLQKELWKVYE